MAALRRSAVNLALAVFLVSCASSASTEDEVLMSGADAALFMGQTGEKVFWDLPKLIVWEAPRGLFYELPRKGVLSIRGTEAETGALIEMITTGDLTVEEQVTVSEELQTITGLPLHSAESWQRWWEVSRELPAGDWKDAFVADRIGRLNATDYFTRASAIDELSALYGTTLGYDPKHQPESLRTGALNWSRRFDAKTLPEPGPGPF